jgi:hypothetical protein
MDDMLFVITKSFVASFKDDVDQRKVRFYETVTARSNDYRALAIAELNRLVADPRIAARALALMAEVKWCTD